ncbi:hypothetical protein HPB50_027904 [Hyalomma asiaticum]|nr:hypothetical protein HPB50_027904 [Hyalomma asiaticum]
MAEQGPVESERASPAPGDSPRSGGSVFSADGDRTLIGIPPINLGEQMQTAPVAAPSGVPAPPPAALPSGSLFPNNEPGEEVTQAAFHRAISYQKDITDLLFDPACKVTKIQRSKIIALLRSILQECADIRAVAARQAGRVDELRYQLARPSTVSTGVPGVINPAHPVPGPSYASVLAGKHSSDQVASRMTAPSTLPPHTTRHQACCLYRRSPQKHHTTVDDFQLTCSTEIRLERASASTAQSTTWSSYKNTNTVKVLVGITPNGLVSYISECWGGKVSDKQLVLLTDFTKKLEYGDEVMADRGFNVKEELAVLGVKLLVPAYTKGEVETAVVRLLHPPTSSNCIIQMHPPTSSLPPFPTG